MPRSSRVKVTDDEGLKECLDFVKDNVGSEDRHVQKEVIDVLGAIWSYKKPPVEMDDDILKAKIMLMDAVNGINQYDGRSKEIEKHAVNTLWNCVQDYALRCIHEKAKTYVNTGDSRINRDNIESMESKMWDATARYIHTYNPERAAPITFLKNCFFHGIYDWKKDIYSIGSSSGITVLAKRVQRVMGELREEGLEVNIANIHERVPGYPLDQLQTALATIEAKENMASLDTCTELLDSMTSTMPTPEQALERDDTNTRFYKAIHSLPDDEREAYCLMAGINLDEDEVCEQPLTKLEISKITGRKSEEVAALITKAQMDIYTIMTGHRRNDRMSPNHTETKNCTCSCDRIRFISENDDYIENELESEALGEELSENDDILKISAESNGQFRFDDAFSDDDGDDGAAEA